MGNNKTHYGFIQWVSTSSWVVAMPRRKSGRHDDVAQKITAVHSTRLGAWCGLAVVQQITRGLSKNIKEHYHAENCTAVHYRSVLEQQRTCWSYLVKENLPSPAIKHWLKAAMMGHTNPDEGGGLAEQGTQRSSS